MKEKIETLRNRKYLKYILTFAFLVILCGLFPYSSDDWSWGSQVGIDLLKRWFRGYSGRYAGNLIVLALTRSVVLRAVVMAGMLTGMIYILTKLGSKKQDRFALVCFLLLLTPRLIFRQAIVWTSGFANYVTSIFFTLLYIQEIWKLVEGEEETKNRILPGIYLFFLGVVSTLVVEHVTIYNLLLSIAVIVYVFVTTKKVWFQHVAYFLGAGFGTYYMFSSSIYSVIAEGKSGYRGISDEKGLIYKVFSNWFNQIHEDFVMNHWALNILLAVICVLLFIQTEKKVKAAKWLKFCLWLIILYAVYGCFSSVTFESMVKRPELKIVEGLFSGVYILAVGGYVLWMGWVYGCIRKSVFLMSSLIMVTAPLLVVTPVGSRCLFAAYIFWIMITLELLDLLERKEKEEYYMKRALSAGIAAGMLFYSVIFFSNFYVYNQRVNYIQEEAEKGAVEIKIRTLPYENYVWGATPRSEQYAERYKMFYGLDENITLVPVN